MLLKRIFKIVFAAIPFKEKVFLGLRKIFSFPESIYRHLHFTGTFTVITPEHKNIQLHHPGAGFAMETNFFWKGYGGCEKTSCIIWGEIARQVTTVFDVRAHTGIYSIIAAAYNPEARIYAFEPDPGLAKVLKKNIEQNSVSAELVPLVVSKKSGTHYLEFSTSGDSYSTKVSAKESSDLIQVPVSCTTLSDFIESKSLTSLELMKIDVGGAELDVLAGMKEFLYTFKPVLLIKILSDDAAELLNDLLFQSGYLFYNIDEGKGLVRSYRINKALQENYLICTKEQFGKYGLSKYVVSH